MEGVNMERERHRHWPIWSVAVGDYNEDGFLDVVVTTFSSEPYTVYKNSGKGFFTDVSKETGIADPDTVSGIWNRLLRCPQHWQARSLFFANGHVNPYIEKFDPTTTLKQANQLFLNDGSNKIRSGIKSALPANDVRVHESACFGDIDNDGRIDVLVTASNDQTRPCLHQRLPTKKTG